MPDAQTEPARPAASSEDRSERVRTATNWVAGGLIFAIVSALAFGYLVLYHRSLVWHMDGTAQHFPAFYYLIQVVRQFLLHPAEGFPFWSWQLGLGADTISSLSFYALGDPFVAIGLFFPMRLMEMAFTIAYVARIACAGLFSAMYMRKMGARPFSALVGSLIYCFSAFTLIATVHHPPFGTPLALFPLMLLGAEYVLEHRRSWVLVVAVFFAASSNFYFFYMSALTLTLYVLARYFETTPKELRWKRILPEALRMVGVVTLGLLLAAPVLFPSIAAILATARRATHFAPPIVFTAREYGRYLASLVSTIDGPNSTRLGFAPLGFVLVPALFMRKGNSALKVMLIAFPVIMASPVLSAAYNGFTFPIGRFGYQWLLFVALAASLLLADEEPFTGRELIAMLAGYLALWVAVFASHVPANARLMTLTPFVVGILVWIVFGVEWWIARRSRPADVRSETRSDWRAPASRWIILVLLAAGIAASSTLAYDRDFGNGLADNVKAGKVLKRYSKGPGAAAATIRDDSFYRVQDSSPRHYNDALVQGFRPTAFYFSIMNGNLTRFLSDNDVRAGWSSFSYDGLDDRAALDTLTAVKYYTAVPARAVFVPYGFEPFSTSRKGDVYRNRYALPLGFVYDRTISRRDFEALPVVERQRAMLEGAVVDDEVTLGLPRVTPSNTAVDVPFSIESTSGVTVDLAAGRMTKMVKGSELRLSFSAPTDSELYVQLSDVTDTPSYPRERKEALLGPNPSAAKIAELEATDRWYIPPKRTDTLFSAGGPPKMMKWQRPESDYYWGQRNQLVNLGYHRSTATSATITFKVPGTLTFESLKVLAVPMDDHARRVERLRANPMRSIRVGNNSVSGTVDSPRDGLLFLSIPFGSGWTATVDGRPTKTVRVNSGFTGVPVTAGKHAVELRYVTPGLVLGLVACAAALLTSLVLLVMARRRRGASRAAPTP